MAASSQTVFLIATAALAFAAGAFVALSVVRRRGLRSAGRRLFELRVYHTVPGRLAALESNFRDYNVRFLERHGITSVGYWTPQDSPASGNTLILILAHESREAAARNWKEFRDDPEWQKLAKASEASGRIVERVESTFMIPTDYSELE